MMPYTITPQVSSCRRILPSADSFVSVQFYDRLLITSWGHDPGVVPTSNVLTMLNDALTHSAVLIQVNTHTHTHTHTHMHEGILGPLWVTELVEGENTPRETPIIF